MEETHEMQGSPWRNCRGGVRNKGGEEETKVVGEEEGEGKEKEKEKGEEEEEEEEEAKQGRCWGELRTCFRV